MAKKQVKKKQETPASFKTFIKWFWRVFVGGIASVILLFLLASWGALGKMPSFEFLENPQTNLASQVISADGKTLGKYYLKDNRTPVDYKDLPKDLVNALIATEDARFHDHSGIDVRGTVRAFAFLGSKGGASTISQQLARQLFVGEGSKNLPERLIQKIKEWVIATRLERQYTKEEIIAMYFNIYDFGNNADGIRSAARIYFGKEPQELQIEESAMLVGMFKNSSLFNPRRRPERVKTRRNVVLAQMYKYDYITKEVKDSLQKLPLTIDYNPESHNEGIGTYFREHLKGFLKKWTAENPKENGEKYDIYLDGLKIYTTIDSRMQEYAEEAMEEHMKKLQAEFYHQNTKKRNKNAPFAKDVEQSTIDFVMNKAIENSERWKIMKKEGKTEKEILASFDKKTPMTVFSWKGKNNRIDTIMTPRDSILYSKFFLRASFMSLEPQSGQVKAWVGGFNYRNFKYDMVKQGKRQIGSTFKPFVYATAIDQLHLSPCDSMPNGPFCIETGKYGLQEPWCPKNSDGKYEGMRTLKGALANSVNTVTARLMDKVGPANVRSLAQRLGVESEIEEVPSIALGTPDISLYEMLGAYGTFANKGVYVKPVIVTRIEDKNGTILYEFVPETKDVLSEEVAYTVVNLMEGVTQSGSGRRLRHKGANKWNKMYDEIITGYPYEFKNPIAGKTGTTQNNSDGWFIGMVPNLISGAWVGGEDRQIRFARTKYGQGASMALPIWALFMKKCYADKSLSVSDGRFEKPEEEMTINIDCSKTTSTTEENNGKDPDEDKLEGIDF
ncbi:candidate bifunctional family GT51 b-glycosyltransferase/PBP transpeptidase, candidate murein polymerase [Kordia algicida OT-1]|uniref:Candidate bifunctional family GT51 b-glycosyltransferase/PBP transpeptidase, candidate murein polymerase n=1 Tax=Kordia algicida OT-1 TaxID=391587 RepID=A9DT64_9FLAO|nr:transglycosylase domain-containing protein [Kordia algicida]EDP97030.1 candidate bifunctional family GT51 b-glycosyltransferase/PBP transpeptidase, candidate murein polymerase [Kordia algicida OT-1]